MRTASASRCCLANDVARSRGVGAKAAQPTAVARASAQGSRTRGESLTAAPTSPSESREGPSGSREQVALEQIASEQDHRVALFWRFDTFRHGDDREILAQ